MRHLTPKMDVLSKTLRDATRQDKACLDKDPQMKEIFELQHKWKSLWLRVSQRQAQFEDVVGHLNEVILFSRAIARYRANAHALCPIVWHCTPLSCVSCSVLVDVCAS